MITTDPLSYLWQFIKLALMIVSIQLSVAYIVLVERRLLARFQNRIGPNRVGFAGLLQPIADGIKLFFKEDLIPTHADRVLFQIAPLIGLSTAFIGFVVIPFGPDFHFLNHTFHLYISDLNIGIFFLLMLSSLGIYGVVLAGWASNSKYSLLGGLRSGAQMISYEIPVGLSLLGVVLAAHSLNLYQIVYSQIGTGIHPGHGWNLFSQPIGFLILLIGAVAETNRAPFDLPEAETELVGGFLTEYSSMKFALFFLGEYAAMFLMGSLLTVAFLGGWGAPLPNWNFFSYFVSMVPPIFWFLFKVLLFMLFCMWLRATLPRFRYDQLMSFCWKAVLPLGLLHLFMTALFQMFFAPEWFQFLAGIAIIFIFSQLVYRALRE